MGIGAEDKHNEASQSTPLNTNRKVALRPRTDGVWQTQQKLGCRLSGFSVKGAVLDATNSRLITSSTEDDPEFPILLAAEAQAFVTMWTALSATKTRAAAVGGGR